MKRGYLYIAVTTLLFSSMEVALKLISGQFNPIQLNFSRFLVGGLVLIPFAVRELKKRGRKLDGKALGSFALLGLMGIAVSMSLYQLSVTRIQASVVGVLFSSNPVFVTLFAFLLLHETISKNQIAGLVLDVAGIVLIIQPWHLRLDALGVVYVLLATLLFALYGVCGKRQCARFGGIVVTCFGFLFGAAEMIAIAGLTHIPALSAGLTAAGLYTFASIPFFTGYTLTNLPIVLFIYVGVTGIGFTATSCRWRSRVRRQRRSCSSSSPRSRRCWRFWCCTRQSRAICSPVSRASSAAVWCPSSPACSHSEGPLRFRSRKTRSRKKSKSESAIFAPAAIAAGGFCFFAKLGLTSRTLCAIVLIT